MNAGLAKPSSADMYRAAFPQHRVTECALTLAPPVGDATDEERDDRSTWPRAPNSAPVLVDTLRGRRRMQAAADDPFVTRGVTGTDAECGVRAAGDEFRAEPAPWKSHAL